MKLFALYIQNNNNAIFIQAINKYQIYDMILDDIKDYQFSYYTYKKFVQIPMNIYNLSNFMCMDNGKIADNGYYISHDKIEYTLLNISKINNRISYKLTAYISLYLHITTKLPSQLNFTDLNYIFDICLGLEGDKPILKEIGDINGKDVHIYKHINNNTLFDTFIVPKNMGFNKYFLELIKKESISKYNYYINYQLCHLNIINHNNINYKNLCFVKNINEKLDKQIPYVKIVQQCIDRYISILNLNQIISNDALGIIQDYSYNPYKSDLNMDFNLIVNDTDRIYSTHPKYALFTHVNIYLYLTNKTKDILTVQDVDLMFKFINKPMYNIYKLKDIDIHKIEDNSKIYSDISEINKHNKKEIERMNKLFQQEYIYFERNSITKSI